MDNTFETVQRIIVEQLGAEPDEIQFSSRFVEDLGADSLDIVELIMAFEEEFNIEIPDEKSEKMRTVGDVVNYISPDEYTPLGKREKHRVSREYAEKRFGDRFKKAGG